MATEKEIQDVVDAAAIPPISEAEIKGMLLATGLAELTEDTELLKYLKDTVNGTMEEMSPAFYSAVKDQLSLDASDLTLNAARNIAESRAELFASNMTKTELKKMGEAIAKGLEEGKHPFDVAKSLDSVRGLDSVRAKQLDKYQEYLAGLDISDAEYQRRYENRYAKLLNDRKKSIAHTEMRYAQSEGHHLEAVNMGMRYKVWMTVGDQRVSDVCQSAEGDGWIPMNKFFSGVSSLHPPGHPNCRCTLSYRFLEPTGVAKERADARIEQTKIAKDE